MAARKFSSGVPLSWPAPIFSLVKRTNKKFNDYYRAALMYAQYEITSADLKKETLSYMKKNSSWSDILTVIKDFDESVFSAIGKYFYILNRNGELPPEIEEKLLPSMEKIINEEKKKADKLQMLAPTNDTPSANDNQDSSPAVVVTIQDRLRDKAREVSAEIEGWVDEFVIDKKSQPRTIDDFVSLFKSNDLKAPHARHILQIFKPTHDFISELLVTKDKDLIEGYSNFSKPELKRLEQFYQNLVSACGMMQEAAKVTRAPKKRKPVTNEKLVSKLKYKKDDATLGIVSVDPVQIIRAKEVWLYNTKTRKLSHYKAKDADGLSVKGTSITNFSSDSVEKTLRKPAETLLDFKKAGKVKLRTFLKELTTLDTPCQGKINDNHVILKIEK